MTAHTDSPACKSAASGFGAGKKTKRVELRFLCAQKLVQMRMLRVVKSGGKYVTTHVLNKLDPCDWSRNGFPAHSRMLVWKKALNGVPRYFTSFSFLLVFCSFDVGTQI